MLREQLNVEFCIETVFESMKNNKIRNYFTIGSFQWGKMLQQLGT